MPARGDDYPILRFASAAEWERWLEANHESADGVWIRFCKKGSGARTVVYAEALDVALCYGWIDGQARTADERSYLQRFTPRRARSMWSRVNVGHVERLTREGRMKPAGLRAVAEAKADGRWERAYEPARTMELPPEFMQRLREHRHAYAFYETLTRANKYAIAYRLTTPKKVQTRERWAERIIVMLERGETFH